MSTTVRTISRDSSQKSICSECAIFFFHQFRPTSGKKFHELSVARFLFENMHEFECFLSRLFLRSIFSFKIKHTPKIMILYLQKPCYNLCLFLANSNFNSKSSSQKVYKSVHVFKIKISEND